MHVWVAGAAHLSSSLVFPPVPGNEVRECISNSLGTWSKRYLLLVCVSRCPDSVAQGD